MKWFHHECTAKHDPKLQMLGEEQGAEGLGVYWGLLEEIGHHSDTFHIKITGVSAECDHASADANLDREGSIVSLRVSAGDKVPIMTLKLLARLLFTTEKRLRAVIEKSVEVGLFDEARWRTSRLLYSPAFEHRADNYTRRLRRNTDKARTRSALFPDKGLTDPERSPDHVCTDPKPARDSVRVRSEHSVENVGRESESAQPRDGISPDNVRTHSEHCLTNVGLEQVLSQQRGSTSTDNVRPEQTTEQKEIQKEREKEKEKEKKMFCSVPEAFDLPTGYPQSRVQKSQEDAVLVPPVAHHTEVRTEPGKVIRESNDRQNPIGRIGSPRSPP